MDMPAKRYSVVLYRFRRISSIKRIKPFVLRGIMIYAKLLLVLLTIWGLTGIKSIIFSAYEDMILLVCGLYGVRLLANELQKSKEDQVQKGRENPFLFPFHSHMMLFQRFCKECFARKYTDSQHRGTFYERRKPNCGKS